MKKLVYILLLLFLLLDLEVFSKPRKQKTVIKIEAVVVNAAGVPLDNVLVTAGEGRNQVMSSANGEFELKAYDNSVLLFEKNGYESKVVHVNKGKKLSKIILEQKPLYSGEKDIVELPCGMSATQRAMVGAVSSVSGEELISYPDLVVANSLSGKIPGLTILQQAGEFGRSEPQIYVRGFSTFGNNQAIVLIDGIERSMESLSPEEIKSVTVLKDAVSKILYGPRAANGVVLITTKRGQKYKKSIDVSVDYGVTMPVSLPEYLDAEQYARLYNEACLNDGLPEFYSQQHLNGYKTSSGPDDLKYPNVDYYDYFLKKTGSYRKVSVNFTGGNESTQYFVTMGYLGSNGMEKVGKTTVTDRFRVRGNVDIRINKIISAFLDVAGKIEFDNMANCSASEFFGALSSHRPNEYPFFLTGEQIDKTLYGDGNIYGGSFIHPNNLYDTIANGGYRTDRYFTGQTNLGFNLNLSEILEGLSAKLYITMDNYSYLSKGQTLRSITYAPVWYESADGLEKLDLVELRERKYQGDVDIMDKSNRYNLGYFGNLSYGKTYLGHNFDINALFSYYRNESPGIAQDIKNTNAVLRASYSYKDKYYLEATGALMGSGRFSKANRYQVFPALGGAWIMSEESWFSSRIVDYMKFRVSSGVIGYDATTPFYLYDQRWSNKGDIGFGNPNDDINISTTGASYEANPDLKWEKSFETNIGIDLLLFNDRLKVNADYFAEYRYDIIQQVWSNYQTTAGHLIPYQNWGVISSYGGELNIQWKETRRDFNYSLGISSSFATSKILRSDEIIYDNGNAGRSIKGFSADYIMGYISDGLFPADFNIKDYPFQTTGVYQAGDIKYSDMNNDMIVDDLDVRPIGNSFPKSNLSFDIELNYKGLGLHILGTACLGYDKMLNNSYFWGNTGYGKYSVLAMDRWHADNNPSGTYPRLTVTGGDNNFIPSDFWLAKANFFRLKNIELSYLIKTKNLNSVINKIKIYVRGTNLWTVSGIKDVDPEVTDGGINAYPLLRTIAGGVSISF